MNAYDMEMLEWLSAALDRAAAMARVRTALAKAPRGPLNAELQAYVAREHEALVAEIDATLRHYLNTGNGQIVPERSSR